MNVILELITYEKFNFDEVDKALSVIPEYRDIRDNNIRNIM